MKVTTTAQGHVSFTQMDPEMADTLVDLVRDLCSGDAVLLYGPGYETPVVRPTDALRDRFETLLYADAKFPGALSLESRDADRWRAIPIQPETHKQVWDEATDNDESMKVT